MTASMRVGVASLLLPFLLPAGLQAAVQDAGPTYQVSDVVGGAVVSGQVSFTGPVPEASELLITRDFEVCGLGVRERREVDVSESGGLRSVVVYISGVEGGKPWPEAPEGHALDQVECFFDPYIQVLPRGIDLQIINSDPILHNIHGYELIDDRRRRTLFNLGQPDRGVITQPLRPRRGQQVGLECDAHDFMLGWIFTADNPYAVVVDSAGEFMMQDVPPGTYTVGAWHPFLGIMEQEITVAAETVTEVKFRFEEH